MQGTIDRKFGSARLLRTVIVAVAALAVVCFAGCGGGGGSSDHSRLRVLNAYVPTAGTDGSLTFTSGSQPLTSGSSLGFGQFALGGGYTTVSSGTFNPTATGTGASTPLRLPSAQTLNGHNTPYTLVSAGQAGQTGTLAPQLLVFPNFTTGQLVIPTGMVAVRVVNVSANPNPVGLYVISNSVPSAPVGPAFANLGFGNTASTGYSLVATSQLTNLALVDVTNPRAALSLSSTSNLNATTFIAGQAYTLYVYGQSGSASQPLGATWVVDFPSP